MRQAGEHAALLKPALAWSLAEGRGDEASNSEDPEDDEDKEEDLNDAIESCKALKEAKAGADGGDDEDLGGDILEGSADIAKQVVGRTRPLRDTEVTEENLRVSKGMDISTKKPVVNTKS